MDVSQIPGWRLQAARIVEELFARTPREDWDLLLDLRGLILRGGPWAQAIAMFLECRRRLEDDHYLPLYRLRQLLAASLCLAGEDEGKLRRLLAHKREPAAGRPCEESEVAGLHQLQEIPSLPRL